MDLNSVGSVIRKRREALGLTQAWLAQMSGLSRQTLVGLETGSLSDLGFNRVAQVMMILGLDVTPPTKLAREKKRGLWMAAKFSPIAARRIFRTRTIFGNSPSPQRARIACTLPFCLSLESVSAERFRWEASSFIGTRS